MRNQIIEKFKSGFSSSPHDLSESQIDKIIKNDCNCDCCDKNLFEMDDFPVFRDDRFLCDECEIDKYYRACPWCENLIDIEFGCPYCAINKI